LEVIGSFSFKNPFTIKNMAKSKQIKIRNMKKPPSLNLSVKGFAAITTCGTNT
jgi:hypothetical protein